MEDKNDFSKLVALLGHIDKGEMFIAADALSAAGKAAVPALVAGLKSEDVHIRSRSAWVLGKMEEESAVEPLVEVLSDPESKVRSFVVGALGKIRSEQAVPHLIRLLGDDNWAVRRGSAWALGKIGDSRAIRPLCALLRDTDPGVVKTAISAIHKLEPRDESDVRFLEHCVGVVKARAKTTTSPGLRGKVDISHRTLKRWSETVERQKEQEKDIKKFVAEQARRKSNRKKQGKLIKKLVRLSNGP
jgi:bilin biosynthesis protein